MTDDPSEILAGLPDELFVRVCDLCGEANTNPPRKGPFKCEHCGETSGDLVF